MISLEIYRIGDIKGKLENEVQMIGQNIYGNSLQNYRIRLHNSYYLFIYFVSIIVNYALQLLSYPI